MKDTLDPDFEFQWGPALWAAGTVVVVGLVANFVVTEPSWLGYSTFLAGVVASFRSGYYDPSANSAAVGTLLGILLITPALVYTRIVFFYGVEGTGDIAFSSVAFAGAWLIVALIALVPLAYIGATVSDMTRKKVGGPIGY